MNCFRPYPARVKDKEGYRFYGFVSCGSCLACKIQKSSEWAMRLTHEYSQRKKGVFLTLTYNDENLPPNEHLVKNDLQKFFKRLRQYLVRRLRNNLMDLPKYSCLSVSSVEKIAQKKLSGKLKYFSCGEYGDKNGRPHYHAIILGFSKYDKDFVQGVKTSWTKCSWSLLNFDEVFGTVNYDSCRYVADYSFSKQSMKEYVKRGYYTERQGKDEFGNDKIFYDMVKQPPFQLISQGIGLTYINNYRDEILQREKITVHGAERNLPRYYRDKLGLPKLSSPFRFDKAKLDKYENFIKLHRSEFDDYCIKNPLLDPAVDEKHAMYFDYTRKESFFHWYLFKTRKQAEINQYSSSAIHKNRQKL